MKILCFGDSNTYGYDPRSFFGGRYPREYRWVDLLAEALDCTVINAGENGREIPVREREYLEFDRLLKQHAPVDRVLIMLGTNDLLQGNPAQTVVRRMETFLSRIDLEKSRILLLGPPTMQPGEWVPSRELVEASLELNEGYQALSAGLGVAFADTGIWNISLTFDGVHLTEEDHRTFARKLTDCLI